MRLFNSFKNVLIYFLGYVKIKHFKNVKINSVNLLYLIINKANVYFKEINKNMYLALVFTNERKKIIKTYKELWS